MTALEDQIASIQGSIENLNGLTKQFAHQQAAQILRLKTIVRWVIIGLILDLMLTVGGVFIVAQANNNARRIDKTQATIVQQQKSIKELQTRTTTTALCPLYRLFLDLYDPVQAKKQDPNFNAKTYEQQFKVLQDGSIALGCPNSKKGT